MKNLSSAVGGILDEALQADLGWDDDGGEEGEHVWLILGTARGAAIGLLLSFVHPSSLFFSSSLPQPSPPLPPLLACSCVSFLHVTNNLLEKWCGVAPFLGKR